MPLKHLRRGDLVKVPGSYRFYVALPVTKHDIARGVDVDSPGLHLFSGYWYKGGPLRHQAYGKVLPAQGRIVGRIQTHYAATRKCR